MAREKHQTWEVSTSGDHKLSAGLHARSLDTQGDGGEMSCCQHSCHFSTLRRVCFYNNPPGAASKRGKSSLRKKQNKYAQFFPCCWKCGNEGWAGDRGFFFLLFSFISGMNRIFRRCDLITGKTGRGRHWLTGDCCLVPGNGGGWAVKCSEMPATERADSVVLAGRCTVSIEWRLFFRGAGFLSLYLPPPAMEGKTQTFRSLKRDIYRM